MERDTLRAALGRFDGVELSGDEFRVAEGHRVTFYLGRSGQAMSVEDVEAGRLDARFLELKQRPPKRATLVFDWEALLGVRVAQSDDRGERRPGFG